MKGIVKGVQKLKVGETVHFTLEEYSGEGVVVAVQKTNKLDGEVYTHNFYTATVKAVNDRYYTITNDDNFVSVKTEERDVKKTARGAYVQKALDARKDNNFVISSRQKNEESYKQDLKGVMWLLEMASISEDEENKTYLLENAKNRLEKMMERL